MKTSTVLTQKIVKFNKLFGTVTDYYTDKWRNGELPHGKYFDIIADIILNPTQVILYANQMLEDIEKEEKAIDNAECPKCGSEIEIESEDVCDRYTILGFACSKCNWRAK